MISRRQWWGVVNSKGEWALRLPLSLMIRISQMTGLLKEVAVAAWLVLVQE